MKGYRPNPARLAALGALSIGAGAGLLALRKRRAAPTAKRVAPKVRRVAKTKVLRVRRKQVSKLIKGQGAFSRWFPAPGRLTMSRSVMGKISGKNQYVFNMAQRLTAADGRQNATSVQYYDGVPLRAILSQFGTNTNDTRRLLLKSSYHEYTFTNASNTVAYLTLYDIVYKRDLETIVDSNVYLPEIAWNTGEIQEGNSLGSSLVGSYPTRIGRFNDFYKIVQKSTHLLAPGEVHKHKVLLRPNRLISANLINEKSYYRGLTSTTMFVVQGTPVDNSGDTLISGVDGSGNPVYDSPGGINGLGQITTDICGNTVNTFGTNSIVTTSPCAVNTVYSARYEYAWIQDLDSDVYTSNNLQSGVGGLDVMEITGLPYTVINT